SVRRARPGPAASRRRDDPRSALRGHATGGLSKRRARQPGRALPSVSRAGARDAACPESGIGRISAGQASCLAVNATRGLRVSVREPRYARPGPDGPSISPRARARRVAGGAHLVYTETTPLFAPWRNRGGTRAQTPVRTRRVLAAA